MSLEEIPGILDSDDLQCKHVHEDVPLGVQSPHLIMKILNHQSNVEENVFYFLSAVLIPKYNKLYDIFDFLVSINKVSYL